MNPFESDFEKKIEKKDLRFSSIIEFTRPRADEENTETPRSEITTVGLSSNAASQDEAVSFTDAVLSTDRNGSDRPPGLHTKKQPKLWAVGGGKGGVGKSLICANFALSLARRGRSVIALDLDLGGSNLHTCLGVDPPKTGIGDWVTGRQTKLEDLAIPTGSAGLKLISGSTDPIRVMHLIDKKMPELIAAIRALEADDVIIDLGAGTHDFTIELFNLANEGILSILPEPTSVENAYRFIKAIFFRRMKNADVSSGIKEVIDAGMDQKNILGIKTPADLFAIVERLDEVAAFKIKNEIRSLAPSIVINQVRSQVDIDVGRAICSVCRRYFGIELKYAGYIDYDNSVWRAIRSKKAVIQEYPHSVLANRIERLTRALLGEEKGLFP